MILDIFIRVEGKWHGGTCRCIKVVLGHGGRMEISLQGDWKGKLRKTKKNDVGLNVGCDGKTSSSQVFWHMCCHGDNFKERLLCLSI